MGNRPYIPNKSTAFFPPTVFTALTDNSTKTRFVSPKQINSYEFFVLSDGIKRVYTDSDALSQYGSQKIWHPSRIAYMSLFINGILQPNMNYEVTEGRITLQTEDIPTKGCPIILQMIKLEDL
ncbi:DUF4183 domain-containing protein [Bacillus sp. FJAT-22090]|uniref:DUF4183 domain-containing protein n=1 Tax=Bacillus sp. FJAT-22090 TaxID=1581038 RepID=UPI0011A1E046|nr:DUF4183 domain-containing protein [Bacillus sp. FJAT-22090]